MSIASKVLTTVNASYGAVLTAEQLGDKIVSLGSVANYDCFAFAFFTDLSPTLQIAFVEMMKLDTKAVTEVANGFAALAGYDLALAT